MDKNLPVFNSFRKLILTSVCFVFLFSLPTTVLAGSLSASVESMDAITGLVTINGYDSKQPTTQFTFNWGDGTSNEKWFAASHTYADRTQNYLVQITAHYSDGTTDTVNVLVQFTGRITPIAIPSYLTVTIPSSDVLLKTRIPGYDTGPYSFFADSYFTLTNPRSTIEYVLSVATLIQFDFANNNVYLPNGNFNQVVLRNQNSSSSDSKNRSCYRG
jgi:hypothetical protein